MTKWINLPSWTWYHSKFIQQPLMTKCHLINNVFIMCRSLIIHYISTTDKYELSIAYNFFSHLLHCRICLVPPLTKISYLSINKLFLWIFSQFCDYSFYYNFNWCIVSVLVITLKVLFYCFQPTHIIMCMTYQMNCHIL